MIPTRLQAPTGDTERRGTARALTALWRFCRRSVPYCCWCSHSDVLRQQREARDGTVKLSETTGASRLNRTDIRFGDLSKLSLADLKDVDETVMRNLKVTVA